MFAISESDTMLRKNADIAFSLTSPLLGKLFLPVIPFEGGSGSSTVDVTLSRHFEPTPTSPPPALPIISTGSQSLGFLSVLPEVPGWHLNDDNIDALNETEDRHAVCDRLPLNGASFSVSSSYSLSKLPSHYGMLERARGQKPSQNIISPSRTLHQQQQLERRKRSKQSPLSPLSASRRVAKKRREHMQLLRPHHDYCNVAGETRKISWNKQTPKMDETKHRFTRKDSGRKNTKRAQNQHFYQHQSQQRVEQPRKRLSSYCVEPITAATEANSGKTKKRRKNSGNNTSEKSTYLPLGRTRWPIVIGQVVTEDDLCDSGAVFDLERNTIDGTPIVLGRSVAGASSEIKNSKKKKKGSTKQRRSSKGARKSKKMMVTIGERLKSSPDLKMRMQQQEHKQQQEHNHQQPWHLQTKGKATKNEPPGTVNMTPTTKNMKQTQKQRQHTATGWSTAAATTSVTAAFIDVEVVPQLHEDVKNRKSPYFSNDVNSRLKHQLSLHLLTKKSIARVKATPTATMTSM
mmetsp:Transcript_23848/g.38325  ORF Transcript_23848/g.38325 Transcript_23848/m.38325 type:complete len:517 (-) Transcript_23848:228-1778(-)